MIKMYLKNKECEARVANLFTKPHADKHVSSKIERELVMKFQETGSVKKKCYGENQVLTKPVVFSSVRASSNGLHYECKEIVQRTSVVQVCSEY